MDAKLEVINANLKKSQEHLKIKSEFEKQLAIPQSPSGDLPSDYNRQLAAQANLASTKVDMSYFKPNDELEGGNKPINASRKYLRRKRNTKRKTLRRKKNKRRIHVRS